MKLTVDDKRAVPMDRVVARTVAEAIRLLDGGGVEDLELDHDIAHEPSCGECGAPLKFACPETFEPVARFVAMMPPEMRPKSIRLISSNPAGAKAMAAILDGKVEVLDRGLGHG